MLNNYNINPYFDDYNDDKNFHRMLFKPSFAVQSRELTQMQTILQKQIERFGNHVFKNGSVVTGGQFFFQETTSLKLQDEYSSSPIQVRDFDNKTIFSLDGTKRAEVIKVYDNDLGTGDPKTLIIQQIFGDAFVDGEVIRTDEEQPFFANITTEGVKKSLAFSVNEGIFYFEGVFIRTVPQTIAISKYNTEQVFSRIGFDIVESVVTASSDTSLLDPALGSSNFQAPGSDRIKIDMVLNSRTLESLDDEKFIELVRIEESKITKEYKYPLYSVLEDTLARRTFDESGNYTVRPFKISIEDNAANSAQTDIILSPGKAYVYGYEFETNAPTVLTVDKPRNTDSVNNKRLSADYGNFVHTTEHFNTFPINSLDTVDIHCVPRQQIGNTLGTIANTKIGTARISTLEFNSSSNVADSQTYEYRTFLFDINIDNRIVNNVQSSTSNTQVVIGTVGDSLSTVQDAYAGCRIRIVGGPGQAEPPKTITSYDPSTRTVTLNQRFVQTLTTNSRYAIEFEIKDAESIVVHSSTNLVAGANISNRSKDFSKQYNDVFVSDFSLSPLIIRLGEEYIAPNTVSDISLTYKRLYQNQLFFSNESPSLSVGAGETIPTAASVAAKNENYKIVVTNQGTSSYTVGSIIPSDKFTVDTLTRKITVENSGNMQANIIASINSSNPTQKSKVYYAANTVIQTSGGIDVFGNNAIRIFPTQGQVHISADFLSKSPNQIQSLFMSDVKDIVSIRDFSGSAITDANLSSSTEVSLKYNFDNGQKDAYYDHASIRLRPGVRPPTGPVVVFLNRFTSSGSGYFTVDSYSGIEYGQIPSYTSRSNNTVYDLRDCIDFRPVRRDATSGSGSAVVFDVESTTAGPKILKNGSDVIVDYEYYLPRIDKVVLDKKGAFEILEGVEQLNPASPKDTDSSMTLYVLSYRPYVTGPSEINVEYRNNRRYTMRDIGGLEKRIENLEYYTSLSLLEESTLTKQDLTILDSQNLPRFKNGILVDSFKGTSVSDVLNPDYNASIDPVKKELRPSFTIESFNLKFDSANSTGFLQNGPLITANAASVVLIDQPLASRFLNVNPFNVINFLGKIELNPTSDIWVDTLRQPELLVNFEGNRDAWEILLNQPRALVENGFVITNPGTGSYGVGQQRVGLIITGGGGFGAEAEGVIFNTRLVDVRLINPGTGYTSPPQIRPVSGTAQISYNPDFFRGAFQTEWGSWQTTWTGTEVSQWTQSGRNWWSETTQTTTGVGQARTGIVSQVVPETIVQSIGDRIVDVSVIPFMRSTNILFVAKDFKPNSTLYPFFDNVPIEVNVGNRVNKFVLKGNNLQFKTTLDDPEFVTIRDGSTIVGEAIVVHTSNNILYVTNVDPNQSFANASISFTVQGQDSGITYEVESYEHNGGNVSSSTANTVTLRLDAVGSSNQNQYVGKPIFISQGLGAGQTRTIVSYDPVTRVAVVNSNWEILPDITSFYSIGRMKTDQAGSVCGIFTVPEGKFRVGEKLFRLSDNQFGDLPSSTTSGDATFFASGLLQRVEETIISTTVPQIQRTTVQDAQVITNTTTSRRVITWSDPLAETFLVSPVQYPQGIFLSKIRVCFKSKDTTIPVTLQVRPTVNGYPSSSVIYPFSTVSLTPDKVNITDSPSLDDPSKFTDFIFDAPIYLQPGEHSFVLLANSNKYEVYVAEIGKQDLVSGRQISEQPYGGSLFLSQNGSTWTADQNSDMTFRMFRYNFSANPVNVQFLLDFPDINAVPYDLTHLITSDVTVANTALGYEFNSETLTSGYVGYKPITPLSDYDMNDGFGTRILNPQTGESTFILSADMQTVNPDVSPIIDIGRIGFLAVHNRINNLELSSKDINVTNGGSGYPANNIGVTVTISGGGGTGATAEARVGESGSIEDIYIVDPGEGYTGKPTVTISSINGGSGATAEIIGETDKNGGPALARYITRRVTLNDGFESGDLRVYMTAYRPVESKIHVYAKFLSSSDPEPFEDKGWQLLTPIGNANFVSANKDDYRELVFAPGVNGIPSNSITYETENSSYNTFRMFAIKIVMVTPNTSDVPKVRDLRAIAIPSGA
jgi:hypothetical protein